MEISAGTYDFAVTATPTVSGSAAKFSVTASGTAVRLNPSTVSGNTLTLSTQNAGGTSGATGIAPPYQIAVHAEKDGVSGATYTLDVTR